MRMTSVGTMKRLCGQGMIVSSYVLYSRVEATVMNAMIFFLPGQKYIIYLHGFQSVVRFYLVYRMHVLFLNLAVGCVFTCMHGEVPVNTLVILLPVSNSQYC